MKSADKIMAEFFYEQCAGTTTGHMAMIPNNPVIYGLIKASSNTHGSDHAASQTEFAAILRKIADDLATINRER